MFPLNPTINSTFTKHWSLWIAIERSGSLENVNGILF